MSSLDKLTIKGFKSIEDLEDFELNNLNVIIGGNGAGKSNLINFFQMLYQIINGNLGSYKNINYPYASSIFSNLPHF
ncbi:MAG: AAA family ATPase [Thermodesulfobacteriota bacterium]|nr:AAA family ATPase [Thermodesulfobacteriota bacterium]